MTTQVASPVQSTKVAELSRRTDGTVAALSSDGNAIYTVYLSPLSCTCRGFTYYGHCYHATQAAERFGRSAPSTHTGSSAISVKQRIRTLRSVG